MSRFKHQCVLFSFHDGIYKGTVRRRKPEVWINNSDLNCLFVQRLGCLVCSVGFLVLFLSLFFELVSHFTDILKSQFLWLILYVYI